MDSKVFENNIWLILIKKNKLKNTYIRESIYVSSFLSNEKRGLSGASLKSATVGKRDSVNKRYTYMILYLLKTLTDPALVRRRGRFIK